MKKTNTLHIMYILCVILTVTFIASFFFNRSEHIREINTVLVNPKYKNDISEIEINTYQYEIVLKKKQTEDFNWIGVLEQNSAVFPLKDGVALQLIDHFSEKIALQFITDNIKKYKEYGLTEELEKNIVFRGSEILSSIYFGNSDFTYNNIYLRSAANQNVYKSVDFFSTLLPSSPSDIADVHLVPLIAKIKNEHIERVTIENLSTKETYTYVNQIETAVAFDTYIETLLAARGSEVEPAPANDYAEKLLYVITLKTILGNTLTIEIYKSEPYLAVPKIPNTDFNYAITISEWTLRQFILPN